MATYNEIIYNLKNLTSGGITSDNNPISNEQLLFIFNSYRALFVRRDLREKGTLDPNYTQTICMEVQCATLTECCDIKVGKKFMRTTTQIPKILDTGTFSKFSYVGDATGSKSYLIIPEARMRWNDSKFTSNEITVFERNGYLYFSNMHLDQKYITVAGIFSDPSNAQQVCGNSTPTNCDPMDNQYPISEHLIPLINEEIYKKELRLLVTTANGDTNNNARADGTSLPNVPR